MRHPAPHLRDAILPRGPERDAITLAVAALNEGRPQSVRSDAERIRQWRKAYLIGLGLFFGFCLMLLLGGSMIGGLLAGFGLALMGKGWQALERSPAARRQSPIEAHDRIFPALFARLDDLAFTHARQPSSFGHMPASLLPPFDRVEFGDILTGRHEDIAFELYDMRAGFEGGMDLFRGLVLAAHLPKAAPCALQVRRKAPRTSAGSGTIAGDVGTLKPVTIASRTFAARHELLVESPEQAAKLPLDALASIIADISAQMPWQIDRLSLQGRNLFVLVASDQPFFDLPSPPVLIDYDEHLEPLLGDMAALLSVATGVRDAFTAQGRAVG
jgi:hypothetical protein